MKLFPFQQRTFEFLSQGRSVILQAPTGAGKTLAALHPFFLSLNTLSASGLSSSVYILSSNAYSCQPV